MKRPKLELPLRTALLYLLFGCLWILLSDQLLFRLVLHDAQETAYQTVKGWFFVLVSGILIYALLLGDLAGRKRAEESLRNSQAQMAGIFDSAMDAIITTDAEQRIVMFNPAAEAMFHCSQAEAMGQPLERFIPERFRSSHREYIRKFAQTGATTRAMGHLGTLFGLRNNGEEFPLEASISRTSVAGNHLFTVILRDITRRRQEEKQTLQLKRLYATLSQVNQTIVRVKSQQELFESICKVAVEFGEFRLAWMGLYDRETGQVTPVAESGTGQNKLPFRNININKPPYRDGLVGLSARSGLAQYSSDIQVDPRMAHWQEIASRDGYYAAAALPIHQGGQTVGFLNLYATDIGFFTVKEERDLLEEMGLDISFALDMIEKEAERKRADEALQVANARFQHMIDANIIGISIADASGKIVLANDYYLNVLDATRQDLLEGKVDWRKLTPPEWVQADEKAIRELRERGVCEPFEKEYACADGTRVAIYIAIASLPGPGEQVIAFILDITERKQAEKEILSLSKFPSENPSPVMRVTQDGVLMYANQACEELLQSWKLEVGQKMTERWQEHVHQALQSGLKTEVEVESSGKCYSCILSPVQNAGYINIYCFNITERKAAEAELRASEERFRRLFENNHTVMMLIDPVSGAIRNANQAAEAFYGYPLSRLCTMNINEINQLTPDEVYAERMRALKEEMNYFHFPHRLCSGEIRFVEVHSAPVEVDGDTLLFSIIYDITERKQAEEKLKRHINYLTGLREVDQAIASSFDVRLSLSIITARAVPLLKVDAATILLLDPVTNMLELGSGNGFWTKIPYATSIRLIESYAGKAVMERRIVHIPNLLYEPHNLFGTGFLKDEKFLSYYGVPLIVKGKVVGVMEVFHRSLVERDQEWFDFLDSLAGQAAIAIDNARLWEQVQRHARDLELRVADRTAALNRTNAELEHANRAKDEFLANMSHELRTPLNSILGLSESLLEQRRDPLTEHQQKSLEIISSSGHHLLELINDVLDLSKIEAGKFDHYPQMVDVDTLCRSSLSFVRSQAVRKSLTISYNNAAYALSISADPRRLKQILVNLLTNAVKFTPEHGQVTLQVHADAEQELMQFSVLDNGIGIAPQDLKRLFQPFVQVDSKLNRQFEGTGLGLALVQKLTDLHGGSVEVESVVGSGSRFAVNLPWRRGEAPAQESTNVEGKGTTAGGAQTSSAMPEEASDRGIVLLAEDNMVNILTIAEYLGSYGFKVAKAHDGLEAIEKAEASDPAIILMDIQMPVMDGLEAIHRLRANPRFAATPIVAITALAMPGDRERCLEAGANEYLSKPVRLKVLLGIILKLTGQEI